MNNQREKFEVELRKALANMSGHGTSQEKTYAAVTKAAKAAGLDSGQMVRLFTGGDVWGDGQRAAEACNFAVSKNVLTALAKAATATQTAAQPAAFVPVDSHPSNFGAWGDKLRELLRSGPAAPVHPQLPRAATVNASHNHARQPLNVAKAKPAAPKPQPLRKAAVDELRAMFAEAPTIVKTAAGRAKVAELEQQFKTLIATRGVC